MPPTRAQISIALDGLSGTALDVLIADGTSIGDAVRAAIVVAARQPPEQAASSLVPTPLEGLNALWLSSLAEGAPRLSAEHTATRPRGSGHSSGTSARPRRAGVANASGVFMSAGADAPTGRRRGRPPQHLLSGIAMCGVCEAPLRVGAQNIGGRRAPSAAPPPPRYRVYECPGWPGQPGFHVSIRHEHLDRIVTNAVLARIAAPRFEVPLVVRHPKFQEERRALLDEIQGHRAWLESVREAFEPSTRGWGPLRRQEEIVLPKIADARRRIAELEKRDPFIAELQFNYPLASILWDKMPLAQRRHVIEVLVDPRIHPVPPANRGVRGPNEGRVELNWR